MTSIDIPVNTTEPLEGINRKRRGMTNPRHLQMLATLEEHYLAEFDGDLERIMRTLVPDPQYHFWGPHSMSMEHISGADAVREYYVMLIASGGNLHEPTFERFIIDDDGLFSDSVIKVLVRGQLLEWMANNGEDVDPKGTYLSVQRSSVIMTFDESGLMIGEDIYSDEGRELIRVD